MLVSTVSIYSAERGSTKKSKFIGAAIVVPVASPVVEAGRTPPELISLAEEVEKACQREDLTVQNLHELGMKVYAASKSSFDQGTIAKLITMIHDNGVPKVRKEFNGDDTRRRAFAEHCLPEIPVEGVASRTPKALGFLDEAGRKTSPFENASPHSPTGVTFEAAEDDDEVCVTPSASSLPTGVGQLHLAVKDENVAPAGFSGQKGVPVALVVADVASIEDVVPDPDFVTRVQTRVDNIGNQKDFKRTAQVVIAAFKGGTIDYATYHQAAWTLHRAAKEHKALFATRKLRKDFEEKLPNPEERDPSKVDDILQHHWAATAGMEDFYRLEDACAKSCKRKR